MSNCDNFSFCSSIVLGVNIEEYRDYCLFKPGVTEGLPFDDNTLVFKVMGKIFALANMDPFQSVNLKCEPELALKLRAQFTAVIPGYHMNKKHWNTVEINGDAAENLIKEWIDNSYILVVKGLTKNLKTELSLYD
ncbi:MAG: putative DNA-binding protein (MmcQ/YjbR family) [Flavobacteriales bacterium]|jgi:predicted DNA-binding protein (MmcQ/YjbR family)